MKIFIIQTILAILISIILIYFKEYVFSFLIGSYSVLVANYFVESVVEFMGENEKEN